MYDQLVGVSPGTWTAEPVDYDYQWLRDGEPIGGATNSVYRPTLNDIDHPLSVVVTATDADGNQGTATSEETAPTQRAKLRLESGVEIKGELRFLHTVKVSRGTWSRTPQRYRFQWFRGEEAIVGAVAQQYRLGVADVGKRIKARVYVKKRRPRLGAGHRPQRQPRRLPRARAPHGHLPDRDSRTDHRQRPRVRAG